MQLTRGTALPQISATCISVMRLSRLQGRGECECTVHGDCGTLCQCWPSFRLLHLCKQDS